MRRILLLLAGAAVLTLPAAATARLQSHGSSPGFLVVRGAFSDGGIAGRPVATVVVQGFVIGHIAQEGAVQLYHLAPSAGSLAGQATGVDVSRRVVTYHGAPGVEYSGSGFRFRTVGGAWRVVVYGAGISLYAGGEFRRVALHGSVFSPHADGDYSFDGGRFRSLPSGVITKRFGAK